MTEMLCWYRSSGRNVSGTVSCPVACWLTFSHENSWCQNLEDQKRFPPVSTIRQNLKQESHPRKSFKSYTRHMNMVSPFRHSLVGYWPSLALVKSSSAFVKREVARLLQFHSHEISYSRPTAKKLAHLLSHAAQELRNNFIGYKVSTPKISCRLEVLKLSTAKTHHPIKSKFGPCRFDKMMLPFHTNCPSSSNVFESHKQQHLWCKQQSGHIPHSMLRGLSWPIVTAGDGIANNTLSWKRNPSISRWKHVKNAFVGSVFARYLVSRSWICGLSLRHCVLYKATISPASTQSLPAVPSSLLRRAVKKHVSPFWLSVQISSQHIS